MKSRYSSTTRSFFKRTRFFLFITSESAEPYADGLIQIDEGGLHQREGGWGAGY
jgi:hypothetical protein